jgi:hypothetical protein
MRTLQRRAIGWALVVTLASAARSAAAEDLVPPTSAEPPPAALESSPAIEPSPAAEPPKPAERRAAEAADALPDIQHGAAAVAPTAAEAESPPEFQPSLALKIFSDIDWAAQSGQHSAFQLGGVDFFITGELTEQLSALSESMLEFSGGESELDLERIYLEWHPRSWLQVRLGKDHVMLGRYMQTYHHALLFQLATARPVLFAFEDEGGVLPAHQIGLEVKGDVPVPGAVLHYALGLGNGRGRFSDDVQDTSDLNAFKSVLAQVAVLPDFVPGLEVGISGYLDRIPPGLADASGNLLIAQPINEYIAAIHAAYVNYPIDAQSEAYWLEHASRDRTQITHLRAAFLQLGVDWERWTPYARFEAIRRDATDAFFNASQTPVELTDLRGGLRYSLTDQAVLKAEFSHDFASGIRRFVLQAAFGVP